MASIIKSNSIELGLETSSAEKARTGVLVVGAFVDAKLPPASRRIDEATKGRLSP